MDPIEATIRAISIILDKDYYPAIMILTLIALAFSKHRRELILSFLVVVLLTASLKAYYQEERPCVIFPALVACNDYGFPSGHTITSILLPAATLGSFAFFMFLPLSFLIMFSRVYLGVHTVNQVVAGLALGLFVFFAMERLHSSAKSPGRTRQKGEARHEEGRQLIHIFSGFCLIGLLYWFGLDAQGLKSVELLMLGLLVSGMMLINMRMVGMWIGPFGIILNKFDRPKDIFPGRGPLMYLVGVLLILSFSRNFDFMLGALAIFAVGDGVSTFFGMRYGANKLWWNKFKSWEGTIAFFILSSIAAFPFIGAASILYSGILAIIETLDFHIDDNLLIPFVAVLLNTILG